MIAHSGIFSNILQLQAPMDGLRTSVPLNSMNVHHVAPVNQDLFYLQKVAIWLSHGLLCLMAAETVTTLCTKVTSQDFFPPQITTTSQLLAPLQIQPHIPWLCLLMQALISS